jgi:Uma2 family endonuclease
MAQRLVVPSAPQPGDKMTYEEFLDRVDDDTRAEWVNGDVLITSPASLLHQRLAAFLATALRLYVEEKGLGEVITPPFQMKLPGALPGREPDVLFVASESLGRLRGTYLDGAGTLVVEVVSPESRARDRGDKYYEYEQGGVREYWLIDPERKQAEFYQLTEGTYALIATTDGFYRSREIEGLWLRVEWLWRDPLPPTREVLREWGLALNPTKGRCWTLWTRDR